MEESKSGMTWLGVLFFVVILLVLLGGGLGQCGGGLWGGRGNCGGYAPEGGCNRVSNCEVEKREIIDSARTQYLTEQQGETTRLAIRDSRDAVMGQLYSDAKFTALTQQLSDCCCAFNRRLDGIECNMLTKPNLYGVAATCNGQTIPGGFNLWRDGCGPCGNNRNI